MDKSILEIMIENLTNERLDEIVFQNEEYREAEGKTDQALESLRKVFDKEQSRAFEEYMTAENHRVAVYIELSYRQGMKDLMDFLISLL